MPQPTRSERRAAEHAARKAANKQSKLNPEPLGTQQTIAEFQASLQSRTNTMRLDPIVLDKPVSAAQLTANQANAKLSTGPITPEGKAISSRNHTTHGLTVEVTSGPFEVLPSESQSDYDHHLAAYRTEWKPTTATEHDLVERMVTHAWLQRRARRLQDQLLSQGMTDLADYKRFEVFSRYHNIHMRAYNKAFTDLMRLRNFQLRQKKDEAELERRAQETKIRFESQKQKTEQHAVKMETLRLKLEAQKHRNSRLKPVEITTPEVESTLKQAA